MKVEHLVRPGILIRLSNLIILQVLFIFTALALILFYPDQKSELAYDITSITKKIHRISREVAQYCPEGVEPYEATGSTISFGEILEIEPSIHSAALYRVPAGQTGQVIRVYEWVRSQDQASRDKHTGSRQDMLDHQMLRYVAGLKRGQLLSVQNDPRHSVHYYRMPEAGDTPQVLAVVFSHDPFVSPSADIQYTVFLLFLVSTLISLLTIYLIIKRLKDPIDRLIRGLEKTAEGELFYIVESDGERELNRLAKAFNHMSRTLWDNHRVLKDYNARLKEANISLLESQLFLSTLIDSSPSIIVVTSTDGVVMLANDAAAKAFGCPSSQLIGCGIGDLLLASVQPPEGQSELDNAPGFEALCKRYDGDHFPAYVIMAPIRTGDTETLACLYIVRDITESKNFQAMMVRLDRYYTRGQMAGDIAHEMNNYLAILSGNLELMPLLMAKGNQEKINKKVELMKSTVDRIVRFANGLMETSHEDVQFRLASLNQVVENVLAFLKPQNKFDDIRVSVCLSPELPSMEFDQAQIEQLLVNLVYNAAEALADREGEKEIHIATLVTGDEGARFARVEVGDNGPGVSEDKVELLFKNRFTTRRKGHGIGLITCRKIITAHNGEIGYVFDNGALFYFEIPLQKRETAAAPMASSHTVTPGLRT